MRKNLVHNVEVFVSDGADLHALADKISEFHVSVIERRLVQSNFTTRQKIEVVNKIIQNLKAREQGADSK